MMGSLVYNHCIKYSYFWWRKDMSGLKSAWELSLEKSDELVPELKGKKKLNEQKKAEINEIRKEYRAKIADKDVTVQDRLKKLSERTPPEEMKAVSEELLRQFGDEKKVLEAEMESEVEAVRQRSG